MISTFIFISVLIVLGLGFIVLYTFLYSRNANKVLKTERKNILLDKGPWIQMLSIFVIIVLLIVIIVKTEENKKILERTEDRIVTLERAIQILNSEVSNLRFSFNTYKEDQKNIQNAKYNFVEDDAHENRLGLKVSFSLKEVHKDSQIAIKLKNIDNQEVTEHIFDSNKGPFEHTFAIDFADKYDVFVIENKNETIYTYELFKNVGIKILEAKAALEVYYEDRKEVGRLLLALNNDEQFKGFEPREAILKVYDKETNAIVYQVDILKDKDKSQSYYEFMLPTEFVSKDKYTFKIDVVNAYGTTTVDVLV